MSPPELTGNTPVADILKPVEIRFIKMLRNKFCFSFFYCINRRTGKWFHFYKPLFGYTRLYCCSTTVTSSYVMIVVLNFYKSALFFQIFYDGFSCFISIHARILLIFIHDFSIVCHHINNRQVMAQSNLKVIWVMCRRDFYDTGTKFHIYIIISNQRNFTVYQRQNQFFANQIFIPLIIRIHGYCCITKKCLRTCCSQINITASIRKRIAQMPKMSFLIFILYFRIRNRSQAVWTPVDDSLPTVNQTFIIKIYKNFLNCFITALIHRKTLSIPITGRAHFLKLRYNSSAEFIFPCPCTLQKLFSANIVFCESFFFHCLNNFGFGCN